MTKDESHPWSAVEHNGNLDIDIAIVGAGASGLYSAWRLLNNHAAVSAAIGRHPEDRELRVALFDSEPRVGGRLLTLDNSKLSHVANLGGMRFLPQHALLKWLLKSTGLDSSDILPHKFKSSWTFTREVHDGSPNATDDHYRNLRPDEKGKNAGELVLLAISSALSTLEFESGYESDSNANKAPGAFRDEIYKNELLSYDSLTSRGLEAVSPPVWSLIRRYGTIQKLGHRKLLHNCTMWDVLQLGLSTGAFAKVKDGLGYHTIIGPWSAAEAIPWFISDFATSGYETVSGGMETVTRLLKQAVDEAHHALHGTGKVKDFTFLATHLNSVTKTHGGFELQFTHKKRNASVIARRVILALPRGALRRIRYRGLSVTEHETPQTEDRGNEIFQNLCDCVIAQPLLKFFSYYKEPWWIPDGEVAAEAKVVTDLPLRQVFFHVGDIHSKNKNYDGSLGPDSAGVMAYCDARFASYWNSLRFAQDAKTRNSSLYCKNPDLRKSLSEEIEAYGVSEFFARHAHHYLLRIAQAYTETTDDNYELHHDLPELIFYKDWSEPPFYGGWHSWKIGHDSQTMRKLIRKPFHEAELYICGEAYSIEQGWIEGALRSAEFMLQRFGISPPNTEPPKPYKTIAEYIEW